MIDYKEYSKERSILRKRLERIIKAGEDDARVRSVYARVKSETVKVLRGMTEAQQRAAVVRLRGWKGLKSLTLTGIREEQTRTIQRLHEKGLTAINKNNLREFGRYMEAARAMLAGYEYDSEGVAIKANEAIETGMSDAFYKFLNDMFR